MSLTIRNSTNTAATIDILLITMSFMSRNPSVTACIDESQAILPRIGTEQNPISANRALVKILTLYSIKPRKELYSMAL